MTARRTESGFTLLELLVALVVFSLVLFVLHQGFDAATRVFERQRVMLSSQDDLYAADRLLRQIVATADPGNGRDGPVFTGGPHGLSWRGTPPAALDNRPDARATMQVSLDRNGHIVLIWAPYRHVIEPAAAPRASRLLSGVAGFDCQYYAAGQWRSTWYGTGLPELVRLRLIFPADTPRRWPDIVIAPRLEAMP